MELNFRRRQLRSPSHSRDVQAEASAIQNRTIVVMYQVARHSARPSRGSRKSVVVSASIENTTMAFSRLSVENAEDRTLAYDHNQW